MIRRWFKSIAHVLSACALIGMALSATSSRAEPIAGLPQEQTPSIDSLLADLPQAQDAAHGKLIEQAIIKQWMQSGSPSADLLMSYGLSAMQEQDYDRAFFYFNEVVALMPGFAEGWNRRAHISFLKKSYASALKDFEQTLRLSPRNFTAMVGIADILQILGDKKGAQDLLRRARTINPWIEPSVAVETSGKPMDGDI